MTPPRSKRCWRSLSGTICWQHMPNVRRRPLGRKVTCKADGIPHRGARPAPRHRMIQHRTSAELESWIIDATPGLLGSFAKGIVQDRAYQPTRLAGEPHNLFDRHALLHQSEDSGVLLLTAQPAGMLPAFGAAQYRRVDHIAAHGLADRLHRPLHDGEECRAGVLHQVPSVGNLYRVRATIGGGLDIAGTTIPRDDLDRGSRGKPRGNSCRLAVGQQTDDATPLQIADDRAVALPPLERPVIDADHARRLGRQCCTTPDDAK